MNIFLFHSLAFETWSYLTPFTRGIGCSEVSTIELATRFARRGHEVTAYIPLEENVDREWGGVHWRHFNEVDWSQKGLWILYRDPLLLDKFPEDHPGQVLVICSQDEFYKSWTPERVKKMDWLNCLTTDHQTYMEHVTPYIKGKVRVAGNGIRLNLIREIEKEPLPERNPRRIMYASSPDRGLFNLLEMFPEIREVVPDAEIHCFYGFDNIDKLIKADPKGNKAFKIFKTKIEQSLKQPGVIWHGRIPQKELAIEWFKSGIFGYPTSMFETFCETSTMAQACGAIPITSSIGALNSTIISGILVEGEVDVDPLTKDRFYAEFVSLLAQPELQEMIRKPMMRTARELFNWERVVDTWESWIYGYSDRFHCSQFNFQLKHSKGKILNIGCDIDIANLKDWGSRETVNLDVIPYSKMNKQPKKADILADARELPESLWGRFDTVIVGDVAEHLNHEDRIKVFTNAGRALSDAARLNGGGILITAPDDQRSPEEQGFNDSGYHTGLSREELEKSIIESGLKIERYEELEYGFAPGHALICKT